MATRTSINPNKVSVVYMKNQSDVIEHMTDREVLTHLYITQLFLLAIASVIGFFLFDLEQFKSIWQLDILEILLYGGVAGIGVVLIDLWLMKIVPAHHFDDGGINNRVFQKRSYLHIFVLCWIIAIAEEWLFRGVIQTHFGFVVASVLFAFLHVRYLKKWVLFLIVISLSFLLGYLYEITENLFVTIFAHFLIDFIFGVKIRIDYLKENEG
ncbi:membrane protease YdiL (CAAX protease family) [Bacillus mesophilus]|nr:membrane protease YdiL (CAAX protease family) [Bacillus mesophilus]